MPRDRRIRGVGQAPLAQARSGLDAQGLIAPDPGKEALQDQFFDFGLEDFGAAGTAQ